LARKEREIQSLQGRVIELERQLAEAQAVIQALTERKQDSQRTNHAYSYEQILQELKKQWGQEKANLLASEERLQSALIIVPYPLMIGRDDGQVVMINAAWAEITGYSLEEIPTIDEWTRKAHGKSAPEPGSEILSEGFAQNGVKKWGEYEITTRSGEKRIWDFSTTPLGVDQHGRRLTMAMAVDITERKQAEEKLRAARDEATWLARFPNENPNPVIRVSREGIILYCNSPATSVRGWRCAVDTKLSRPLLDLVELAIEQDQLVEQDVLLGDKFYSVSVIPLLKQGYLNLYGRDVTERKQAEKALAESEHRQREITRLLELDQARLAAVLRHLPVGVWIIDEQGRLMGSNPEAERIWAGEVPVDSPADYQKYISWHPGSGELLKPEEHPITVALLTGETMPPMEMNIRRFDGSEGTVLASAVPIKDGRGQLIGVVAVNVEITERKRAEEHIAYQARLLETVNDAIVGSDAEFRLTAWNAAAESMYGWKAEEVLGRNGLEILQTHWPQEDANEMRRMIAESGRWRGEATQLRKDGTRIPVEVSSIVLHDERGQITGYVSVNRDITERKKTEEALRISEERFAKAFHASPDAIVISRLSDGLVLEVNEGWSTIFGHRPNEVIGQTTLELGVYAKPEDRQIAIAHLRERGFLRDYEVQIRRESGEMRRVSLSAERIEIHGEECLLTIIQDITERDQAEWALRESEQRLKRAQEIAHLGSWELDLINNRLMWSDEVYRIFGLQPQEFDATYEAFLEAVHPDDRAAVNNAYTSSIQEGRDSYEIEHRVVRRSSGEVRIVHEKCEHFRNQSGQMIRSIGMVHDITERKQVEEQLRVYANRLEKSNR
jgi:PAS domain S-box-containing protein